MKVALVLEGGASRGFFTTGVLDYFLENDIYLDHVYGSSMGAINGLSYLARQEYRIFEILMNEVDNKKVISLKKAITEFDIINWDYIIDSVFSKEYPLDFDELNSGDKTCICTMTPCEDAETTVKADLIGNDNYVNIMKATTALPPLFSPVEVDGKLYLDGGISDPIPYKEALEKYDKVIIVKTQDKTYRKEQLIPHSLVKIKYFKHPSVIEALKNRHEVYNRELDEIDKLRDDKRVFILEPMNPLSIPHFTNDTEELLYVYYHGKYVAKYYHDELLEFLKEDESNENN